MNDKIAQGLHDYPLLTKRYFKCLPENKLVAKWNGAKLATLMHNGFLVWCRKRNVKFFRHVEEGSLEEHRIRVMFLLMGNINCHTDFAGIKEQTAKYGIGCYDVYDLKDKQWKDRIKTVLI